MVTCTVPKQSFTLELKENGRVVLPKALRNRLHLKTGDRLIVNAGEDGRAELVTIAAAVRTAAGMYAHLKAEGESVVDDFIAERHADAERE